MYVHIYHMNMCIHIYIYVYIYMLRQGHLHMSKKSCIVMYAHLFTSMYLCMCMHSAVIKAVLSPHLSLGSTP